jgi:hypothetical protein
VQCAREDHVGELRILVANPAGTIHHETPVIAAQVPAILAKMLLAERLTAVLSGQTAVVYDTCFAVLLPCFLQKRHQLSGQQKVAQMVRLHLHIKTVLCSLVVSCHDSCIIGEDVETAGELRPHFGSGLFHTFEVHQVTVDRYDI